MDLIYMNERKRDVGVMKDFTLDLAYGADENDFELTTTVGNNVCKEGYFLYIEGTDYGGIIDEIRVRTNTKTLIYYGRTWHGVLESKILEPDAGQDYLIVSGELNQVLAQLLERMHLTEMFNASEEDSGFTVTNFQMDRYIDGYKGIVKMLKSVGAKLKIVFREGWATLSAIPIVDYSANEEFDSSQIDFDIIKKYHPVNHLICLGQGELRRRNVVHLYADKDGNISETQTQFGVDEVTGIYENVNLQSFAILKKEGTDHLKDLWDADSLNIDFKNKSTVYDIGDIVGAREILTGMTATQEITKKIIILQNDRVKISYKVGE